MANLFRWLCYQWNNGKIQTRPTEGNYLLIYFWTKSWFTASVTVHLYFMLRHWLHLMHCLLQVWLQKAKTQTPTDSGDSDKKRKRTEEEKEDNTPPKSQKTKPSSPAKKPLSQSTNSKLAGFAFSSKPWEMFSCVKLDMYYFKLFNLLHSAA